MLRYLLFFATNMAILLVLSVVLSIFGISGRSGQSMESLLLFCAIFGFAGSFISLALSKWMALRSTGAQVIKTPQNPREKWLLDTVAELARKAEIGMPDVAMYHSDDPNAFATGMNKNSALVAVSTGLLSRMSQEEVKAVLAHEVSHIQNGDMVTLTLIQGVVNTFVMFFARLVGAAIDKAVLGNKEGNGIGYYASVFVLEIVFGFLASMIVMWFSRQREFRADSGAAHLYNPQSMIAALRALQGSQNELPKNMKVFGIGGGKHSGLMALFSSHPPIEERIKALSNTSKTFV